MLSWATSPSQHFNVSSNLQALSQPCCLEGVGWRGGLWRLHYAAMIDYIIGHWWLRSISSPFPRPRGGGRAESSNSNHIAASLAISPHPETVCSPTWRHLININSGMVERGLLWITKNAPVTPIIWKIPRVLEALWQEPGTRTKYLFHIITPVTIRVQESGKWRGGRFQCWFGF